MGELISRDRISFLDPQGQVRTIYGVSLRHRQELKETLDAIEARVLTSKIKTLAELYDYDFEFQALALHALKLQRIDPDWVSVEMLAQFLLHHEDEAGMTVPPLLEQINTLYCQPGENPGPPVKDPLEENIAAIWSHTQDLEKALQVAGYDPDSGDNPSWLQLQKILQYRNEALDPKKQQQRELRQVLEKMGQQPTESGAPRFLSEGEVSAIAQAARK
ncbi:MAG: hypothetical protein HC857_00590 [Synechococcales cyanobacterium RU_4_20]|nr:hypothetical protein [Synechococcales cyanobacterium RU_4_20]